MEISHSMSICRACVPGMGMEASPPISPPGRLPTQHQHLALSRCTGVYTMARAQPIEGVPFVLLNPERWEMRVTEKGGSAAEQNLIVILKATR